MWLQFSIESVSIMSIIVAVFVAFGLMFSVSGVPVDRMELKNEPPKDTPIVLQDTRIIGGIIAPEGYAPHMVALVFGETFVLLVCGGSIVGPHIVLTAAHCILAVMLPSGLLPSFRGVVGSNRFDSPEETVFFSRYVIHPNYNAFTYKNDIGVLITTKPIVYTDRIAPISLDFEYIYHEERSFVTGWGETQSGAPVQLQLLNVSTIYHEVCETGVEKAAYPWSAPPVDPIVEICTFHSPGHGMCMGDSGSALVSRGTGRQIGIVAWGFPCAIGAPDVFARISGFKDFMAPFLIEPTSEIS